MSISNIAALHFAEALIRAIAGEGRLQGDFELASEPTGPLLQAGLFYIEDVPTYLPSDINAIKARIRNTSAPSGGSARVQKSTSFTWADRDIRVRFCNHLMVQPANVLVVVEGVLSYEDLQSQSPTPLWGSLSFFRDQRALRKEFDAQSTSAMSQALDSALKQARIAVQQVERKAALRAVRRLETFTNRIRSTT